MDLPSRSVFPRVQAFLTSFSPFRASLQYEILRHPETVDLHLSLTYIAVSARVLKRDELPVNMALRVKPLALPRITYSAPPATPGGYPVPSPSTTLPAPEHLIGPEVGEDGSVDFDALTEAEVYIVYRSTFPFVSSSAVDVRIGRQLDKLSAISKEPR